MIPAAPSPIPAPAAPPARPLDRKKLALIHIVKKELKLNDTDYRCVLERIAGVSSARDLDEAGFRRLMRFFVRSDYFRANSLGMTLKQKLFIKALARQLGWDPRHLTNFIRKYYRKDGLKALDRKEASKLIESLKAIQAHEGGAVST
ncbi:MAG TPA: phage protein GemA/Gp16 family protein [Acidobacteriota bacterium]|nr:phage protein GemA/Gp16 family protein [Acidobacteriota bacterium]